jgi:hypothetical protein
MGYQKMLAGGRYFAKVAHITKCVRAAILEATRLVTGITPDDRLLTPEKYCRMAVITVQGDSNGSR